MFVNRLLEPVLQYTHQSGLLPQEVALLLVPMLALRTQFQIEVI
jgi:hypothetical protein